MHRRASKDTLISSLSSGEQLRVILETSPAAVVVIDDAGIIRGFGNAAQRLFGYTEDEALGQNVSLLMAPAHAEQHDKYMESYRRTGERRMIGFTRVENACDARGHIFPVEITLGEAQSDGKTFFIGFMRDLGEQMAHRRELRDMLDELAHESRISAMGAFATAMAHELNQPLTAIANYTEGLRGMIEKREDIADRHELMEILDTCSTQAVRAGQLINRLRDFVRGGHPHVEMVDVGGLIDNSVTLALINGYRRNVKLDRKIAPDLPPVGADPVQAQQVLFNLIRNAFEAMHADEQIGNRLLIEVSLHGQDMIEFVVADSGPGIDPKVVDRMFEGFVTTKGGGMGVGLSICKQIVERYGGAIWATKSVDLGGASFHFTLPVFHPGDDEIH